jgi:hypothetical protein
LPKREPYNKRGTSAGYALGGQAASVAFHNLFAYGQSHAYAVVFVSAVETLKRLKNSLQIFLVEPDSVIGYTDLTHRFTVATFRFFPLEGQDFRRNSDVGLHLSPGEFQCIADEILEKLQHLDGIRLDAG